MKIAEIDAQIEELHKKREKALKEERSAAKETVRELCKKFGFTSFDLRGALVMTKTDEIKEELYAPIAAELKAKREAKKAAKKSTSTEQ